MQFPFRVLLIVNKERRKGLQIFSIKKKQFFCRICMCGGPSLSHVFLASKQRSTLFSSEMIYSVRVNFHFILSLILLTISISDSFQKVF